MSDVPTLHRLAGCHAARCLALCVCASLLSSARAAPTTLCASVAAYPSSTPADGRSEAPSISADGRYVAFASEATTLVPGDSSRKGGVLVLDRQTGQIERMSVNTAGEAADETSTEPSISADGRFVAFTSYALNLHPGTIQTNKPRVFVHDRQTGQTDLVSKTLAGGTPSVFCQKPSISADGRFVAFESLDSGLVVGDTNGRYDIFVYDRQTGGTTRESVASDGAQGNHDSKAPSISADGRYVAFESLASNLVAGESFSFSHIYVRDRETGQTERVSKSPDGSPASSMSFDASLSADGRFVAFRSGAANLVADDTNNRIDVFVYDRQTGRAERVNVSSEGVQSSGYAQESVISADGRYVAFASTGATLVEGASDTRTEVFVHDRPTGQTRRVSATPDGLAANDVANSPSISADGSLVAFASTATNIVENDRNSASDVFVRDIPAGQTSRASQSPFGPWANGRSVDPSLSADGRFVAFMTGATNLLVGDTTSGGVVLFDRQTGQVERVSKAIDGSPVGGSNPVVSGDGHFVAYRSSTQNIVENDTNYLTDLFLVDRQSGQTQRVNVSSDGTPGNRDVYDPAISANGRFVAFHSHATNLVPNETTSGLGVFVRDLGTGETRRVGPSSIGVEGNRWIGLAALSADGRTVVYQSGADNLVTGDTNKATDIFRYDWQTGQTERVSLASNGQQGNMPSVRPAISADGRVVAFWSLSSSLAPGDTAGYDIFVRDTYLGQTERIPVGYFDDQTPSWTLMSRLSLSADGRFVTFTTDMAGLVPDDTNGADDVYVYDRKARQLQRVSLTADGAQADHASYDPSLSADGSFVAFTSDGALTPDGSPVNAGVYLRGPLEVAVIPPYTLTDVAAALKAAGGLTIGAAMDRLNVADVYAGRLDLLDAARLARKTAGLEPNP